MIIGAVMRKMPQMPASTWTYYIGVDDIDRAKQIDLAYRLTLCRPPLDRETRLMTEFLAKDYGLDAGAPDGRTEQDSVGVTLARWRRAWRVSCPCARVHARAGRGPFRGP